MPRVGFGQEAPEEYRFRGHLPTRVTLPHVEVGFPASMLFPNSKAFLLRLVLVALVALFAQSAVASAAVTYRACNAGSGTAFWPYTVSFTKPAGTVAGDLIVIQANVSAFYDAGGPPAGFTELHAAGNPASFTWYKIAGASEPGSYTTEFMPATSTTKGVITTWTGTHPTLPIDGSAMTAGSGTSMPLAGNGATVPRSGSMRVNASLNSANTTATFTGMSKVSCEHTSAPSVGIGYEAVNAGTLAARTATVGNGSWSSQMLLLRPAPTAPTITTISPSVGPEAGGTSVVITGTDFTGATQVRFGATNASSFTINNDGQITATAPAGTGTQNVTVTTGLGTSANTAADDFTYYPLPTITSISPAGGPTAGGTSVTITGTNFSGLSGAAAVRFGATNAASYTVNSATSITATAPAGTGSQDVRVTTPGGTTANTAADDFTYYAPPTITSLAPGAGPEAGGNTVTITGTSFAGLSGAAAVRFGATNATSYTVNSTTSITATAPPGTGTQDVSVTTPGGTTANTAADNYTYYAVPTVTSISPTSGPAAGGTPVTITGTNFAGLSGASAVTFGATNATSYTVNSSTSITATAPAGTATQDVRVTTPGGTTANTSADDFTYIPLPTVTAVAPSGGPTAAGTSVTITGTGFTGATQVQFGAVSAVTFAVDSATQITATAPAGSAGTVDVRVTTGGGTSANTAADNYTYYALPTITSLSPTAGPTAGGTSVTITGTGFSGLSGAAAVQFGGVNASSYTVNSATSITATAPAGAAGAVDVRVTTPGGTSANTASDDYTYVALPTVTSISPAGGPTGGGTTVTITGTNFTGATQVRFGATNASGFTVNSATSITATAPAGAAGVVDVRVTTAGGQSANTSADDYTYAAAPTITSISPMSGPAPGGTTVTITGTNLTGATAVAFGAAAGTSINVVNSTTVTVVSPAGTGTVDVRLTTPGGTSPNTAADDFTYIPAPTVASLNPTSGPVGGGTAVTITGTSFTGATSVTFGGATASFSVVNGTTITATAPAGSGTADVRVTTPSGTSANTAADDYTYLSAPVVSNVSPASGPDVGGTSVTITGTAFTGTTSVSFGGVAALGFTVVNSTTITATAPPHSVGTVDVRVTTGGGTSANTASDDFEYLAACGAGSLGLVTNNVTFTPFTLDGTDHTRATSTTVGVSDMTGAGLGWKLEVGTTQFTAGPGKTLPASAARITSATATPLGGSCSSPTSTVSSYPITLPLSPSKTTIYNADTNTGRGPVDVGLNVALDVPANSQFGTYQSTWTVDLTAAP